MKDTLDTILFDLDGTLIAFEQDDFLNAYFSKLTRFLAKDGYDPRAVVNATMAGSMDMIKNDGSMTNSQRFWATYSKMLGSEILDYITRLDEFYLNEFDGVKAVIRSQRDLSGFMAALRKKGYRLVLATSPLFPISAIKTRLSWVGLKPEDFSLVTTYDNCTFCKPNPEYYREILGKIEKSPQQCLMVGNSLHDDAPAAMAGLDLYIVHDYLENPDDYELSSYTNGSFEQLTELLLALPEI